MYRQMLSLGALPKTRLRYLKVLSVQCTTHSANTLLPTAVPAGLTQANGKVCKLRSTFSVLGTYTPHLWTIILPLIKPKLCAARKQQVYVQRKGPTFLQFSLPILRFVFRHSLFQGRGSLLDLAGEEHHMLPYAIIGRSQAMRNNTCNEYCNGICHDTARNDICSKVSATTYL